MRLRSLIMAVLAAFALLAVSAASPAAVAAPATTRLLTTQDFSLPCLTTQDRYGPFEVERFDVVFQQKSAGSWRTVWQATDGDQFIIIVIPQNPPWICLHVPAVAIPATWTQD